LVILNLYVTEGDFAEGVLAGAGHLPDCASAIIEDRVHGYLVDLVSGHGLFPLELSIAEPHRVAVNGSLSESCGYRVISSKKPDPGVHVYVTWNDDTFSFSVGNIADLPSLTKSH
jgi:hypothetical protein